MATTYVFRVERAGASVRREMIGGPHEDRRSAFEAAMRYHILWPAAELQVMSLSERNDIERAESVMLLEALGQTAK